jgi:protein TonB
MGMGLFLSILFHAAVVAVILQASIMPMGLDGRENRIEVELLGSPPPEPPKPIEPEKPRPILERPKEASQPIRPKPVSRLPNPANDAAPEAVSPAVSMAAEQVDAPQPALPTAPETDPAGREEAMQAYARTLWAQIISHKPRGIRFQGTVMLSFSLSVSGDLLSADVSRSSGIGSLDQAALGALKDAAPFPQPPAGLSAGQLSFTIPFTFQ